MLSFPFINFPNRNYISNPNRYNKHQLYNNYSNSSQFLDNTDKRLDYSRNSSFFNSNLSNNDTYLGENNYPNPNVPYEEHDFKGEISKREIVYENKKNSSNSNESEEFIFNIFGIKLYLDDLIIIALLFFLYNEGVKDDELFIALVLLLLS